MTTRKKQIVAILIALMVALTVGGGFVCYRLWDLRNSLSKAFADQVMGSHPLPKVNLEGWARVHVGMTQQEVVELLGEAPSRHKLEPSPNDTQEELHRLEFWEYNYTHGFLAPIPHPKAYVIFFDRLGKVTLFTEPAEETPTAKENAK